MPDEHSQGRLRIFAEDVPAEQLTAPDVIRALARRNIQLVVSVRPPTLPDMVRSLPHLAASGVDVAIWPMVDDADGRWANLRNLCGFFEFAERVLDALDALGPAELFLDLEPPIGWMRRVLAGKTLRLPGAPRRARATATLEPRAQVHLDDLRARCRALTVTAIPLVLFDPPRGDADVLGGWHRLLGVPDLRDSVEHVHVMLYTSLLEGFSAGFFARADALALLHRGATRSRAAFGGRAGVSLGTVGHGVLGNEPPYRSPRELAEDVAVVRSAGIEDLALFDLGGVLRRPPLDAWLDAFVEAEPRRATDVALTWRARAAIGLGYGIGRAF